MSLEKYLKVHLLFLQLAASCSGLMYHPINMCATTVLLMSTKISRALTHVCSIMANLRMSEFQGQSWGLCFISQKVHHLSAFSMLGVAMTPKT